MLPDADKFKLVATENGWRVKDESGKQLGEYFQECCRSDAWKAALVVFEKYKRSMNLNHENLLSIKERLVDFTAEREAKGKKANYDFLVQEASSYVKKSFSKS